MSNYTRRTALAIALVVLVSGFGTGQAGAVPVDVEDTGDIGLSEQPASSVEEIGDEAEDEDSEAHEEEDESGANFVGDWWGLGGEVSEAPYVGLAEGGVVLLAVGVFGYSLAKRWKLIPVRYRRYQLQAHQWIVLVGTGLTLPHFLAVEEWEGLGLAVGVLLGIEVASGLYGRYLHRHVVRLGRGDETPSVGGRLLAVTKESLFSRWRRVHVLLTIVTAVVLVLHIVTAVGD